ncbi:MAG: nitrile hydratase accessory protein [Nevskia sp.]|nr:nitrile hydratase accessory protein [Nevskia sp.]
MSLHLAPALPADLPAIPADAEGPVFREPWEAQIFALVIRSHQRGAFTWNEWAETLGATIKAAQASGDADLGDTYYQHWVDSLETLLIAKGLTDPDALHALEHEIAERPTGRHTHVARRVPVIVC